MAEAEQALKTEILDSPSGTPEAAKSLKLTGIISSQMEALRGHHRNVLETDEVESVHKMRVTTRRLQASLDLLEREMNVRKLKRRLREWRRALSRVRNYDVFLQLIEKEAAGGRKANRERFELVKAILQKRRARRAVKVRKSLQEANIDEIAIKLGLKTSVEELTEPGSTDVRGETRIEPNESPLVPDESTVSGYAADRLEQRLAEFQALVAVSHPTNDPAELHQLRIAAKRIRYLLEIVEEMGYGDSSRALAWLRTLQDRIGDWHDLEALEAEIISIVSRRGFVKQHLVESSAMLQAAAHLQNKKEILTARLFPVRVPRTLAATSKRVAKALRSNSLPAQTSAEASKKKH